jgi:hypothetical protein
MLAVNELELHRLFSTAGRHKEHRYGSISRDTMTG